MTSAHPGSTGPVSGASPSLVRLGAALALAAVSLGAFGAHALKPSLLERGTLDAWRTAVDYQMWHALAILLAAARPKRTGPALCFAAGSLLFSGSLYALAFGAPAWLGPVTPLGGLAFLTGWAWWLFAAGRP